MLCSVIVTYGQRRELLYATLRSAFVSGVDKAVVVDNGSGWAVAEHLANDFGESVDLVRHARNLGSAGGFSAGMARALDLGADELLLLDDDLGCSSDSLQHLRATLQHLMQEHGPAAAAVLGYRATHMAGLVGCPQTAGALNVTPPILRFSFGHLLRSLVTLVLRNKARSPEPTPAQTTSTTGLYRVPYGPYGGLLLHRRAVENIGLPDERLVLYWDDIEWTYRLTRQGGELCIDCDAPLDELETSLAFRAKHLTRIHGLLLRQGDPRDSRIYYEVRNTAYFARHIAARDICFPTARLRGVQIAATLVGRRHCQKERARTITLAIRDGLAGDLGFKQDYPLE